MLITKNLAIQTFALAVFALGPILANAEPASCNGVHPSSQTSHRLKIPISPDETLAHQNGTTFFLSDQGWRESIDGLTVKYFEFPSSFVGAQQMVSSNKFRAFKSYVRTIDAIIYDIQSQKFKSLPGTRGAQKLFISGNDLYVAFQNRDGFQISNYDLSGPARSWLGKLRPTETLQIPFAANVDAFAESLKGSRSQTQNPIRVAKENISHHLIDFNPSNRLAQILTTFATFHDDVLRLEISTVDLRSGKRLETIPLAIQDQIKGVHVTDSAIYIWGRDSQIEATSNFLYKYNRQTQDLRKFPLQNSVLQTYLQGTEFVLVNRERDGSIFASYPEIGSLREPEPSAPRANLTLPKILQTQAPATVSNQETSVLSGQMISFLDSTSNRILFGRVQNSTNDAVSIQFISEKGNQSEVSIGKELIASLSPGQNVSVIEETLNVRSSTPNRRRLEVQLYDKVEIAKPGTYMVTGFIGKTHVILTDVAENQFLGQPFALTIQEFQNQFKRMLNR